MADYLILLAMVLAAFLLLSLYYVKQLRGRLAELLSAKQSQATRHGQIFEQLVPFSSSFPYDPKEFRFIGDPIDGIIFTPEKLVFCEIKMDKRRGLNSRQRRIREMVKEKKVEWLEIGGES